MENSPQFEKRKRDHIRIALDPKSQATSHNRLDDIELIHEALPELNFDEINIESSFQGQKVSSLFISSMTAGHLEGVELNLTLAKAASEKNWLMGVGSQRRQLFDQSARAEWEQIRNAVPNVQLIGNVGLSQVIEHPVTTIRTLVDSLDAKALIIHTNPLQEVLQPEGTPKFQGGIAAVQRLCQELDVPIILKETGCGFSQPTLQKLKGLGLHAVDVAGLGGTHWGRVEGARSTEGHMLNLAAGTFKNWGINTVDSLLNGLDIDADYDLWASGGIANGLDAAKVLALGAHRVGLAKSIMEAAVQGLDDLKAKMTLLEYELKIALFCTGCKNLEEFQKRKVWMWKDQKN